MPLLSQLSATGVGLLHSYIMVLEMFLWTKPAGRKAFKLTPEFAQQSKTLGANQGLYNGFLAAGLFWGVLHPVPAFGEQIRLFFLGCVFAAGAYGGITVGPKTIYIQAIPAAVSIAAAYLGL